MSLPNPPHESEPLILALETSLDVCSVAVTRGKMLWTEHTFRHGMHLSERLMSHVDSALADADVRLPDVELFAVGIGPGSFTGTRIGVMTAKTLASVQQKPMVGINGLAALAAQYRGLPETLIVPMLPCRAGVVYTGVYNVAPETPHALAAPEALTLSDLVALLLDLEPKRALLCGSVAARHAHDLAEALREAEIAISVGDAQFPRAEHVARLAAHHVASGEPPDDPVALLPLYISPPPITLPKGVTPPHPSPS